MRRIVISVIAASIMAAGAFAVPAQQTSPQMSFFITSAGKGNGANLGGLAGADAHCQTLAKAAGAGNASGAPI